MHMWILLAILLIPQKPDFKATASVDELMQHLVIPSSDVLFNVGIDGTPDAEEWARIERSAILLSESGDLLLLPVRSQGRKPWIDAAKLMAAAGESALAAARSRDADAFFDISGQILDSCTSCHNVYLQ